MIRSCECGVGHYHYGVCQVCGGTYGAGLSGEFGGALRAAAWPEGAWRVLDEADRRAGPRTDRHRFDISEVEGIIEA